MTDKKNILTKLHKVQLEILNEFIRICKENNLAYFLTGGTLLGAVRHKGFIPWDDDIDIAMPRNDFEMFLDIFDENDTTNYYILSNRSSFVNMHYYFKGYAKLCKKNTTFAEPYVEDPKLYSGIYIDIFPIDNSIPFFLPIQAKLIIWFQNLHRLKTKVYVPQKRVKLFFYKLISYFFTPSFLKTLTYKTFIFFNRFNTKYVTTFTGLYWYKRETHKKTTIFPFSNVSFEGKEYSAPANWDNFLTTVYDDYMKLPPLEKRKGHLPKFISFTDNNYQQKR